MFSDSYRLLKIVLLLGVLLTLCLYSHYGRLELTLSFCRERPDLCDGKKVPIYVDARILEVGPDRLLVSQPEGPVEIRVPPSKSAEISQAVPGNYFEAWTIFHKEGYLELKAIRLAALRKIKIFLSLFPLLIVIWWLRAAIKWEKGRFIIKE